MPLLVVATQANPSLAPPGYVENPLRNGKPVRRLNLDHGDRKV